MTPGCFRILQQDRGSAQPGNGERGGNGELGRDWGGGEVEMDQRYRWVEVRSGMRLQ